jgi:tripartite-type tricarboxylate transporter receptor subunit TctC
MKLRLHTRPLHSLAFAGLCAFIMSCAGAAGYPDRMVRFIVPSPPGGGTDSVSRIIAPKLSEYLGQKILIENRPGASGNIGAELVAKSAPDGYTLLSCIASHTSNPAVMREVPYDFARDFAPISLFVTLPGVLISHPSVPARTVKELIAFVQKRPGQVQYASGGIGAFHHLAMALFTNMTGLNMIHVPYKGTNPAIMDIVAGHVPIMIISGLVAMPQMKAGRVRAYAVSGAKRASWAPGLPTIAESGVPGYDAVTWLGLVAPAGTPRDIINKLHAGIVKTLQDPDIAKRFVEDAADVTPSSSPDEFGVLIRSELKKWAKVVKDAGIQPE